MALNQDILTDVNVNGYSRAHRREIARSPLYTMVRDALAVLRRFGSDAHIYLPGVGMLNGLQAGNYLDSAGTTAGTVDQPVGLALDSMGVLGVELVTVPTVAAVPIGGPAFTSYAVGPATVAGKTYSVSFTVSDYNGTGNVSLDGGTAQWVVNPTATGDTSLAGNGTKNFIIQCANPAAIRVFSRSTNTCTFSNISVREVTGIAASQPTTASKPILRRGAVNLLTYSGDFGNAAWSLGNVTHASGVLTELLTTATHNVFAGSVNRPLFATGTAITVCALIGSGSRRHISLTLGSAGNGFYAVLDTLSGAITIASTKGTGFTLTGSSVVNTSGGWLLCVSGTVNATSQIISIAGEASGTPAASETAYLGDGSTIVVYRAALFAGTYTAQQIQALGGIPLTTTAPASTALGPHFWQFDGSNDSLSLGSVPFQMSDDHWVVAVARPNSASIVQEMFTQRRASSANPICPALRFNSNGKIVALWRDDAAAILLEVASDGAYSAGVSYVATATKVGNAKRLRVNGVQQTAVDTASTGVTTLDTASIGFSNTASGSGYMNGAIYPIAFGKGAMSDADLLLIEKMLGQLSGVQI